MSQNITTKQNILKIDTSYSIKKKKTPIVFQIRHSRRNHFQHQNVLLNSFLDWTWNLVGGTPRFKNDLKNVNCSEQGLGNLVYFKWLQGSNISFPHLLFQISWYKFEMCWQRAGSVVILQPKLRNKPWILSQDSQPSLVHYQYDVRIPGLDICIHGD